MALLLLSVAVFCVLGIYNCDLKELIETFHVVAALKLSIPNSVSLCSEETNDQVRIDATPYLWFLGHTYRQCSQGYGKNLE
jgi:hypothetical protein